MMKAVDFTSVQLLVAVVVSPDALPSQWFGRAISSSGKTKKQFSKEISFVDPAGHLVFHVDPARLQKPWRPLLKSPWHGTLRKNWSPAGPTQKFRKKSSAPPGPYAWSATQIVAMQLSFFAFCSLGSSCECVHQWPPNHEKMRCFLQQKARYQLVSGYSWYSWVSLWRDSTG